MSRVDLVLCGESYPGFLVYPGMTFEPGDYCPLLQVGKRIDRAAMAELRARLSEKINDLFSRGAVIRTSGGYMLSEDNRWTLRGIELTQAQADALWEEILSNRVNVGWQTGHSWFAETTWFHQATGNIYH